MTIPDQSRRTPISVALWRHLSGHHPSGIHPTDAGWTTRGTVITHPTGRARAFYHRPRLVRAGIRWAWTSAMAAELYGFAVAPGPAEVGGAAAAAAGTAYGAWRTTVRLMGWRHRRRVVTPLSKALARPLENTPENILAGLKVPRRHGREGVEIIIPVPDGWHGDRRAVESIVRTRIGGEWDANWRMLQAPFTVQFTRTPEPPRNVAFADVIRHVEACEPGRIVVGIDSRGKPVHGDFIRDEPMWGLSIGSGGGKSSFLWQVAAQLIHQGAYILAIDPKYVSLDPLLQVPGVEIHNDPRDIAGMWNAIAAFRMEMERRFEEWTRDRSRTFPRMVLFLEEGNMFSDLSKTYWRTVKGPKDPAQPPVWQDIAAILRMGRQADTNMIAVFQRMTDAATGGQGLRDSFGFRLLGRFTWQAWASLVGTTPVPRSSKTRGRFIVVDNGEHTWVQSPYGTAEEIRSYCLAERQKQGMTAVNWLTGTVADSVPVPVSPSGEDAYDVEESVYVPGTRGHLALVQSDGEPELYTLAEAVRAGVVPLSYEALKKARQRPGFPLPTESDGRDRWTAEQLQSWHDNRPRAVGAGE